MKRRVQVHHGLGELQRVPSRGHTVRFKIGRTQRRVTTATPVRSPMEQGKEPSQRSFELTAHQCGRQHGMPHSRLLTGDSGWHFLGSLLSTAVASCCRSSQPSQRQTATCRSPRSSELAVSTRSRPSARSIRHREANVHNVGSTTEGEQRENAVTIALPLQPVDRQVIARP